MVRKQAMPCADERPVQEPYRFLAIQGTSDLVRASSSRLAAMLPSLIPPLRVVVATRDPVRVATACLVMSQMCCACRAFAQALLPYFGFFGQVLNLFMHQRIRIDCGYNSRELIYLDDLINHLLWQIDHAAGPQARTLLARHCPLYQRPLYSRKKAGDL